MMKIDFSNKQEFKKLEDKAIDGQLNYDDFPPVPYKYFSKLAKLGYNNRHKGWDISLCEQLQEELYKQYIKELDESNRFVNVAKKIQQNILTSSEDVRNMYKAKSQMEVLEYSLQALEKLTDENGLKERILKKINEFYI